MTIGTGEVSFNDIRTEFGMSGAISYADLYRGGSNVRAKASDNAAVNLAAQVPTSGEISIANFQGQAKGFRYTFTSGATNQNASTLFGDDYDLNYPKEIVINAGVELGATSTSEEALEIPSGGVGTITITNNGTLSGAGGAAGGGAGGDAFEAAVACTLVNNGTIRAGGGGGGAGGTGGQGSYTTTGNQSRSYSSSNYYIYDTANSQTWIKWGGVLVKNGGFGDWQSYAQGKLWYPYGYASGTVRNYGVTTSVTTTHYTSGGSGGSGGKGQGYVSGNASGSGGSGGGTNAGAGGTGGTGGTYGNTGGTGNTGASGNYTGGSGGSGGGAAGKYIRGISFVTYTNNGSNLGGTA